MNTINERIANCIESTGLTKTAFAKRINLSQPHISKIALGYTDPTDRTIADICREFNVNERWLRTGEGEMFNTTPDTLADKLAREYGLDALGRQIMSAYLKLDESDRLAVGRLIQNLLNEQGTPVVSKNATTAPTPDATGQERTETDIVAELAELRRQNQEILRQNQEMAAEIAVMKEEDTLLGLADGFSISPTESAGSIKPAAKAKK